MKFNKELIFYFIFVCNRCEDEERSLLDFISTQPQKLAIKFEISNYIQN